MEAYRMKTKNICPGCQQHLMLVDTSDGMRYVCETEDCSVGQFTRDVVRELGGEASEEEIQVTDIFPDVIVQDDSATTIFHMAS